MIDTSYDEWYLQTLNATQSVQKVKATQSVDKTQPRTEQAPLTESVQTKNTDRVEFSQAATQALEGRNSSETNPAGSIVHGTENQSAVTNEDQPDYRAISLIKNSQIEIEFPKEETSLDRQRALLEERITAFREQTTEQSDKLSDLRKSNSEQPEITGLSEDTKDLASNDRTQPLDFAEKSAQRTKQTETTPELSQNGNTGDEIETAKTSAKITPSEQKGINAYQQMQNYTDALSLSFAATGNIA